MLKPAWLTERPIAHRGLHDLDAARPENTLAAFEAAIVEGFAIECDLRLSGDQRPLVVHDRDLKRLTGVAGTVAALPSSRITRLRIAESDQRVPTLESLLELVAGRVPIFLEMKRERGRTSAFAAATADVLGRYEGPLAIMSFDWRLLRQMAARVPGRPRGLVAEGGPLVWSYHLHGVLRTGAHFLAYRAEDLPSPFAVLIRRSGRPLLSWTVSSGAQAEKLSAHIDQIIFEGFVPSRPAAAA